MKFKLLLFIPIILLTSCAKAPDNVQEQADILDGKSSTTQSDDKVLNNEKITSGTLEQIRNQLASDLENNNTRIRVDNARVGTGTIMPTYDIKIRDGEFDGFKDLVNLFFGDEFDAYNDSLYEFTDRTTLSHKDHTVGSDNPYDINHLKTTIIDILKFQPYGVPGNSGIAAFNTGAVWGAADSVYSEDGSNLSFTYVERELKELIQTNKDDLSKSYPMVDGTEWKVSDAIKYAEEFFNNEYLMGFEISPAVYEVQYVYVYTLDNGNYGYYFQFSRKDENGNYLDSNYPPFPDIQLKEIANNQPFFITHRSSLWTYEKNKIIHFAKDYSFEYQEPKDSGDKLLSLGEAISVLDEKLAPEKAFSIPCAELSYVIYCKGYPFYDAWGVDKNDDYYHDFICLMNCEFEIKPIWVFKTADCMPWMIPGEIYYVDAVTGEMLIRKIEY